LNADAGAILKAHLGELPSSVEMLAAELLAGLPPLIRTSALGVPDAAKWSGVGPSQVYRAVENGELACERAQAAPRKNGRKGASKIAIPMMALARWRAARKVAAAAPIEKGAS